jgi:hypothetical protein
MENTRKVFKRLRRMCGNYFCVDGECVKSGLFAVHKIVSVCAESFKRIQRMRGKDLYVHGEDAKRRLSYSPNTPRDIKV